jgi:hypothetical protein
MLTFNPRLIIEGAKQISQAFGEAGTAAKERYKSALDELTPAQEQLDRKLRETTETVEQLTAAYEEAAAAAKLLATESVVAATRSARLALQQAGLTAADVRAIEARRQAEIKAAAEQELQIRIAGKRKLVEQLNTMEGASAETVARHQQELTDMIGELEDLRYKDAKETADAIVAAEEAAAEQRIRTEQAVREAQLDVMRTGLDAARAVADAQAKVEADARGRNLELLQLSEEVRIGMLRRTVEIEKALLSDVMRARGSLMQAQFAREEVAAVQAAARRAQLVAQGLMTEAEAEAAAEQERLTRAARRLQAQTEMEQQRLAQVQRLLEIETALTEQEAASKLAALQAETDARRAALAQQQALEEAQLVASVQIAHAETTAKIAELHARLNAAKAAAAAELAAREAAGQITPAEREARLRALAAIDQEFLAAAEGFTAAYRARYDAANKQIAISRGKLNTDLEALDRESTLRQQQITQELVAAKVRLESAAVADRAEIVGKLADLEVDAAQDVAAAEAALAAKVRAGLMTPEEMAARLRPMKALQAQIRDLLAAQQTSTEQQLGSLEMSYQSFADKVTAALKPVKDLIELIANPRKLLGNVPTAVGLASLVPALAGANVTQNITNQFTFAGNTWHLTADETAILSRLVSFLLGPEGNALVAQWFKKTPGPRK